MHPTIASDNLSHLLIDTSQLEFADLETQGGAAIATSTGQMEHDRAVNFLQLFDQPVCRRGSRDASGTDAKDLARFHESLSFT